MSTRVGNIRYSGLMPRKRPIVPSDPNTVDANQVVALNFRLVREERGWTQEETAERLAPYLGQRLKKTSISAIERSVESDRRRVFTAQEILAYALGFDVPYVWFLIPPGDLDLRLEGLDEPVANLWRIVVGTDEQMPMMRERLTELAEANPVAARRVAASALSFDASITWDHFQQQRLDGLIDLVTEERDQLDGLFDEMRRLVERYESHEMTYSLAADTPRRAYRRTAEVLLGKKIWELINERSRTEHPTALTDLVERDDVPWEEIIDLDRPEVREAVLQFADAIEPELRSFLEARPDD